MSELYAVVTGSVLGIAGAIGAQWVSHVLKENAARKSLAGALAGEISAICEIARRRRYAASLELLLAEVKRSKVPYRFTVPIHHDYIVVFTSNVSAVGRLSPDLARRVVHFYTQIKGLQEEVRPELPAPPTVEWAEYVLRELIAILKETLTLGDQLAKELEAEAS